MAFNNDNSESGFSSYQLNGEEAIEGAEWVRPPYMLALFIAVTWGISMFPRMSESVTNWEISVGRFLLITATVLSFYGLLVLRHGHLLSSLSRLSVYGALLILTIIVSGAALQTGRSAVFVPVTLLTMVVAVGFSSVLAIESYFFVFFLSAICWIPSAAPFQVLHHARIEPATTDVFFLLSFIVMAPGAITAGIMCESIRKRTRPLSAGLAAGAIHIAMFIALGLLLFPGIDVFVDHEYRNMFFLSTGVVFGMSVASGILLLAILPVVEKLFGIPTDLGLLELTDMNQPALRKLAMEAPGTYHHSLRVGTLAEEAAEAIGANALLARVGSYYHDIGKTTKPQYFIENSKGQENPHERLPSNMSKLILIGHVRDGLELAEEYGLPEWVKDFIAQHHGTSVTEYFFAKQVQSKLEKGEEPDVETADFRYPGPLPRSRETGICMLADSVEATSRSLEDPSPTNIEGMVDRIVEKRLQDGQLDKSGLTLGDIKTIRRTFVEVLSGMLHARIAYPDQEDQNDESTSSSESEADHDREAQASAEQIPAEPQSSSDGTEGVEQMNSGHEQGPGDGAPPVAQTPVAQQKDGRQIFVLDQQDDVDLVEADLRELTHFVLDAEQCDRDISLVLLKKAEMRELHRQYLQEDRPTDVLAFPLSEPDNDQELDNMLGEVMVCPAIARSRAADLGHSTVHETYLYVIHGLLHLLGYDDKDKEEEEKMKTRQEELLESFVSKKTEAASK